MEDHTLRGQDGTEQFAAPRLVPEAEFTKIKAESVKIYAYANRVLSKACAEQEVKNWGFEAVRPARVSPVVPEAGDLRSELLG